VKVLFVMRHPAALRSLRSVLKLLDERGHHVHLLFGRVKPDAHKVLQQFADECRTLTFGALPARGSTGWSREAIGWDVLAKRLRRDADYLRYLDPSYADAPALRTRAAEHAHPRVRRAASVAERLGPGPVRLLRRSIERVERCLDPPPHVERFVADFAPDVVVVTHLARDSVQADFVRAAKRLGVHTAYPVFSWDNLTNKGLVHELPEVVLVWNELQAREAVELQGIPREQVGVLGAWSYDHWFEWQPSRTREEFCADVGLSADRPLVLYVCSSGFVARDEVAFVRGWLTALRAAGGLAARAGVIVRPHPRNFAQWAGVSLDDSQATVWPPLGEEPLETISRQNYFDSIYHSAAVVGINTSAQIESAVIGRPVHTILADEFRETQQGTLHFHYLTADDFGHLHVGRTMEEHVAQLEESLRGRPDDGRNERFLRRFVRPLGLDVPASPRYVEELEALAARPAPAPDPGPALAPLVKRALAPVAAAALRRVQATRSLVSKEDGADELRGALRRIRRDQASPVLACPWLGGETGELLYWIPFLRWCQTSTLGLRDRLVVVARRTSMPWYAGIGSRQVAADELLSPSALQAAADSFPELGPELCERLARELGVDRPLVVLPRTVHLHRALLTSDEAGNGRRGKWLEFAPPAVPEVPAGLELPDGFVAVRFGAEHAEAAAAVAARAVVVALDGLDTSAQTAVLARARGHVGAFGPEAWIALLLGRPAVVTAAGADPGELRAASAVAGDGLGRLTVLDAESPVDWAERALRLVAGKAEALAAV
jgi:hypothetical protein